MALADVVARMVDGTLPADGAYGEKAAKEHQAHQESIRQETTTKIKAKTDASVANDTHTAMAWLRT